VQPFEQELLTLTYILEYHRSTKEQILLANEDLIIKMQVDPLSLEELIAAGAEIRDGHGKANAIIRSTMAIVSLISSSVLIWMIKRSHSGLSTAYHRILLGMCIADVIFSFGTSHFNFTAPSDNDYVVWNARGNQDTCSAQGFLQSVGALSTVLYSCSINLYCLAVVKYQTSDEFIRKIEPFLHGAPIMLSLVINITLLVKKHFNDRGGGVCYAPVYNPPHCIGYEDGEIREGFEIPCGRGDDETALLNDILFFVVIFVVPFVIGISLGMIYRYVLQSEKKMAAYGAGFEASDQQSIVTSSNEGGESSCWKERLPRLFSFFRRLTERFSLTSNEDRNLSRPVLHRALAFSVAYFLTWSFVITTTCFTIADVEWPVSIWYLSNIFNPLQGFFNLGIFMYPKVMVAKSKTGKNLSWRQAFAKAFWSKGIDPASGRTGQSPNRVQQTPPVGEP